jgi:NodT family efflux transporter outer membrane factor (OMF) lipoprotein
MESDMRFPKYLPLLLLVGGLGVARDSQASTAPTDTTSSSSTPRVELQPGAAWWESFGDERLDQLVVTGLGQNLDVRAAELRIVESEASITQSRAPLLPTVSWDSQINIAPTDSLGFQFGGSPGGGDPTAEPPPDIYWTGSSVLNAQLELDLTGRRVLDLRATRSDVKAAKAELGSAQVTMASSVVTAYYDLVAARARARVVDEQLATVGELLELTEARFGEGRAQGTDLLQQRQQLASTTTLQPQAQAQVRAFSQQLAVLLGEDPDTPHDTVDRLPELGAPASVDDSGAYIVDRPDLRAAEARVDSAEKREKVAKREFVPTLTTSATAGVQAIRITEVNDQWYWGAGAALSVPIFGGGRRMATLQQRQAQVASSRNEVERLRLEAQRQIAEAQAAQRERQAILDAAKSELSFASQSYEALRERYFEGEVDVLNLLTALTSKQQAELNLVTAHRDLVVAHVDLQRALAPAPRSVAR